MSQLVRRSGAIVALLVAAIVGALPAMGDDDTPPGAAAASPSSTPPVERADLSVPVSVPAGAAPAIAVAARRSGGVAANGAAPVTDPLAPGPAPSGSSAVPASAAAAADPEVARLTGLSFVLDVVDLGASIGLDTVFGLAVSGFGTIVPTDQLPPELVDGAYEILAVPPQVFDQFKAPSAQGLAALRASLAPLAAGNPAANALLTALSEALIAAGTEGRPLTNPLDAQVVQLGRFLLVLQETG
jgi:hypothetical protein